MMEAFIAKTKPLKPNLMKFNYGQIASDCFNQKYTETYLLVDQCCVDLAIEIYSKIEAQIIELSHESMRSDFRHYLSSTIIGLLREEGLVKLSNKNKLEINHNDERWENSNCLFKCKFGIKKFPKSKGMFELIELASIGMFGFFQTFKSGIDILFSKEKADVWYRYNNDNEIINVYSKLVALAVKHCIGEKESICILEVGAGTGSSTNEVLKLVSDKVEVYLYTDVGISFLRHGQGRFNEFPFIEYKILDINRTLIEQKIENKDFDLVIAMNVVHTAKEIERTLNYLHKVIKPGGWLILGEGSPPSTTKRWRPDIVFGLLNGWWDVNLNQERPRPGFLLPVEWRNLFKSAQFTCIDSIPSEKYFDYNASYGGVVMGKKKENCNMAV